MSTASFPLPIVHTHPSESITYIVSTVSCKPKLYLSDYANSRKMFWGSTAGVGASREGKFDRGPYPPGTRVEVLEMLRDWSPSKQQKHPIHSHSVSGAAELGEWSNLDDPITAPSATRDDFQSHYPTRDDPSYHEPPGSPAKESQTNQNQYGDNFDQSTVARTSRDITNVEGSIVENSYNIENQLGVLPVILPLISIAAPEPHDISSLLAYSLFSLALTLPSVCFVVLLSVLPHYYPLLSRSSYTTSVRKATAVAPQVTQSSLFCCVHYGLTKWLS
ncbi:hypothetical protein PQX77_014002 [Marasmius sp. AFHP31]|nr:hypothetical protein PQX77_014002 [Marasmius sp. AFHP31]